MELLDQIPRWAIEVAFIGYAVFVSALVVLERRRPTATLALVLTLVFLPVVGLFVYVVFSRQRVRRRQRQRARRPINPLEATRNIASLERLPEGTSAQQRGLVRLALQTSAAPLRRADEVHLYTTPRDAWDATVAAIEQAERTIHVEFYIWRDDESGRALTRLLAEQAARGVKVRVLYDDIGSLGLSREHFAPLLQAGGELAVFGELRVLRFRRPRVNFRNHRKLISIDGEIGFCGGLNVGDEYFRTRPGHRWRDLWLRLAGDAVVGLEAIFLEDWLSTTGQVLDLEGARPLRTAGLDARVPAKRLRPWRRHDSVADKLRAANPFTPSTGRTPTSDGPLLQVIPSGPDIPVTSSIATQFAAAISSAQERAWIATPYFIPDEPLLLILRTAALRGVDVRLLVPEPFKNDSRLVAFASRSYYDDLLEVGCRIFEWLPGMMHSKYLIVDDVCAIGSANMDVRSFYLNYEVTAMFYDAKVTTSLAAVFTGDLEQAREIDASSRAGLSLGNRIAEGVARLMSPLL